MDATTSSVSASRALGRGERLWLRLSEVASNNGILVVSLEGPVDPHRLERALACTVRAFPVLRASVDSACGRPRLLFSDRYVVPLSVEPRLADGHWRVAAEEEASRAIAPSEPLLWHARLLLGSGRADFILSFNHAITDGHSLQLVADGILRCYAANKDVLEVMAPPPCYEDHLAGPRVLRRLLRALPGLVGAAFTKKLPRATPPLNPAVDPGAAPATRYVFVELDPERSKRLLASCKARGQSLHGLLGGLLLLASRDTAGRPEGATIAMSAALNVRPKLRGDFTRDVGYFASGFESEFRVKPGTSAWALADTVNRDAKEKFTAANIAYGVLLKGLLLRLKKRAPELVAATARYSKANLHFTNVGRLMVQPVYGDLAVSRVKPLPSVHFMKKPMVCLESHFFRDTLQLTFSYAAPLTDPEFVAGLTARYQDLMAALVGPGEPRPMPTEQKQGKEDAPALHP